MTRVLIPLAIAFVLLILSPTFAFAQDDGSAPASGSPAGSSTTSTVQKKTTTTSTKTETKKTTVNFEDQLIEGQTQKPELFYLLQQRNNNFKRLIKLRENFLPEMRKTGEDISRSSRATAPNAAAK